MGWKLALVIIALNAIVTAWGFLALAMSAGSVNALEYILFMCLYYLIANLIWFVPWIIIRNKK